MAMNLLSRSAAFVRSKNVLPKLGVVLAMYGGIPLKKVNAIAQVLNGDINHDLLSQLVNDLKNSLNPQELEELVDKLEEFVQHRADGTFSPEDIAAKQEKILNDCNEFLGMGLNSIAAIYLSSTALLLIGLLFALQEVKSLNKKVKQLASDIERKITKCSDMINELDNNKTIFNKSTLDNYNELINDVLSLKNRVETALSESKRKKAYMALGAIGGLVLTAGGAVILYNTVAAGVGLTLATGVIGTCTVINGIMTLKFGSLYFEVDKLKQDLQLLDKDLNKLLERLNDNELIKKDVHTGEYICGDVINDLKENSKQFWDENGNIDEEKINELEVENNKLEKENDSLKKQLKEVNSMGLSTDDFQQFLEWKRMQSGQQNEGKKI